LNYEFGNVTNGVTNKRKRGAPIGNKNAVGHGAPKGSKNALGNKGGHGGKAGNQNARGRGKLQRMAAALLDSMTI